MMGFDLNYDAFVGLTFGFFAACLTVRVVHELGSSLAEIRRRLRPSRGLVSVQLDKAHDSLRTEFAD